MRRALGNGGSLADPVGKTVEESSGWLMDGAGSPTSFQF